MRAGSTTRAAAGRRPSAQDLLASDRIWHALGADPFDAPGLALWTVRGVGALPAATAGVATAVPADDVLAAAHGWLRDRGAGWCRLYLAPGQGDRLADRGYTATVELALLAPAASSTGDAGAVGRVELSPVATPADWAGKVALHDACDTTCYGYPADGAAWTALERARTAGGCFEPLLVRRDGAVVGACGLLRLGPLWRFKNLVVAPATRRRGVATSVVSQLVAAAAAEGATLGALCVEGPGGEDLYRRLGFVEVARTVEWSRGLGS